MSEEIRAKVLLVDDEQDFLSSLSERLELRGMQVTTASRGEEAVAMVDQRQFDLIVLDLSMPGIDGLETLRRIKQKNSDAEVIILTGQGSIRSGIEAMKLGAEDFLQKPVAMGDLLEKIVQAQDRRFHILESKSIKDVEKILNTRSW